MNPILESLNPDERRALLAGLADEQERTAIWTELWSATKRLGALGLVEWADRRGADGKLLVELPLRLTQTGHRVARGLAELTSDGQR
jgi:hypothetical protein